MSSITLKCTHCNDDFFSEGLDIYIANLKKENKSLEEKCQSLEERIVSDFNHYSDCRHRLKESHENELSSLRENYNEALNYKIEEVEKLENNLENIKGFFCWGVLGVGFWTFIELLLDPDPFCFLEDSKEFFFRTGLAYWCLSIFYILDGLFKRLRRNKDKTKS